MFLLKRKALSQECLRKRLVSCISNFDLSARDAGDAVSAFLKESLAKNFLRARN